MNLIFGQENATLLRQKYTVLDLETIATTSPDGTTSSLEVFCLIPGEKMPVDELPQLEHWTKIHNDMLGGYSKGEYEFVKQCIEHLLGKFGGELDSFYTILLQRISCKETIEAL